MQSIGIIGAGQMGSGIAQVCSLAGLDVVLYDVNDQAARRGFSHIAENLQRMVLKERIEAQKAADAMNGIKAAKAIEEIAICDLVIEAATENFQIKETILKQLEAVTRPDCVIASNTSSVSITQLASLISNPGRFIGVHFFNPVPVMKLVEVIRGIQTSDASFDQAVSFAQRIGKTVVSVKNAPGFVVNRLLVPMINEAVFVLQEGVATVEEIDAAMKLGANHPIGPLTLADMIGIDTVLAIMEVLYRDFKDPKYRPARLLVEMVDAGRLGRKSSAGFYTYQ